MALTYAFALAGALLFTLTAVPALTAVLLKHRKVEEKEPGFLVWLRDALPRRRCASALRYPIVPPLVGARGSWRCAVSLIPRLGAEFLPEMNEGDIHVTVTMPSAISLERGAEVLRETRLDAAGLPRGQGRADRAGAPRGRHRRRGAQPVRDVRDHEAARRSGTPAARKEQIVDAMRARAREAARASIYNFSQPIKDRVEESISGIRGQIVVKIYGEDLRLMHAEAGRGEAIMNGDARRARRRHLPRRQRRSTSSPTSIARRPRATASRCATSRTTLESAYGGQLATVDVGGGAQGRRARQAAGRRRGRPGARSAGWTIPAGNARLPLAALAKLHVDRGRTQINREQGGRFLALKCNIEGRDMGSFVDEAQARVRGGR